MKLRFATHLSLVLAVIGLGACDSDVDETVDPLSTTLDSLGRPLGEVASDIAAANEEVALDAHLLARVEAQPGELVEFYEPTPGLIVISGAGRPEADPIVDAELAAVLDPSELWNLVSDGAELPPRLQEAIERAAERVVDLPSASAPTDDGAPPTAGGGFTGEQQPLSAGYCDTGYFTSPEGACDSGWDWQMCLNNWWNGAWAQHSDARYAYTNVCPAQGSVALKVYWSNGGGGIWTVNQNYYRYWAGSDWDCEMWFDVDCPTFRMDVFNASGDRFHARVRIWE